VSLLYLRQLYPAEKMLRVRAGKVIAQFSRLAPTIMEGIGALPLLAVSFRGRRLFFFPAVTIAEVPVGLEASTSYVVQRRWWVLDKLSLLR
jgi:hypothetical protein